MFGLFQVALNTDYVYINKPNLIYKFNRKILFFEQKMSHDHSMMGHDHSAMGHDHSAMGHDSRDAESTTVHDHGSMSTDSSGGMNHGDMMGMSMQVLFVKEYRDK